MDHKGNGVNQERILKTQAESGKHADHGVGKKWYLILLPYSLPEP
jgi:hypothetical protein